MAPSEGPLQKVEKATKQATKAPLTCTWADLQPWQRDNVYIHSGYRPATNSYYRSALSLFYIHNETGNVYTHLLPAFVFAGFSAFFYRSIAVRYEYASPEDRYVFACFFAGCVGCLGMSGTYHLLSNHSHAVAQFGNKLDYLGIVSLIWGSFVPSIYYGFACEPVLVKTYWTMITTIGAGCALVSVNSMFRQPHWRTFRASMFAAMGLSAVVPVIHGVQLYGVARMESMMGLRWVLLQGILYLVGAATYAVSLLALKSYYEHAVVHLAKGISARACTSPELTRSESRHASRNGGGQGILIFSATRIRYFTCWSCWPQCHT